MKQKYIEDLDNRSNILDIKQQQMLKDINKLTKAKNDIKKRVEKESQTQINTLKELKIRVEDLRTTLNYKNKELEIKMDIQKDQSASIIKISEAVKNYQSELELLEMSYQIQKDKNDKIEKQKSDLAKIYSSVKALV